MVCYFLCHHEVRGEGGTTEVVRKPSCVKYYIEIFPNDSYAVHIFFSVLLTSLWKSWRVFLPLTCPDKKGHCIIDYLKRFVFKTVFLCHRRGVLWQGYILCKLCMSNSSHALPKNNTSVTWLVSKITRRVLETMQNYKENTSKWLTSHLINYGYQFYGS